MDQTTVNNAITNLLYFAKIYDIDSLFIVGGCCRCLYWGKTQDVDTIEVVSAYPKESLQLGEIFATEFLGVKPKIYPEYDAVAVEYEDSSGSILIEFQSNSVNSYMQNQEIEAWMQKQGIENVPIMNNIYGRDFTINGLLMSLEHNKIYDPTSKAYDDLNDKRICSLLAPDILIKYSPVSVFRAIRLSLKYNCVIDPDLRVAMKKSKQLISDSISKDRIMENVVRILKEHGSEGLEVLKKYNLTDFLLIPEIKDLL